MNNVDPKEIVFLGETNFRNQKWRFGIKPDDRRRHLYVVGSTGMGKSEFLKNRAIQDIEAGRGVCFIDPHGDGVQDLLEFVPKERIEDVIYFNPGDMDYPIAFNIMEQVPFEQRHLVASGLLGVFRKIWTDAWSARMEYILNNTILALLEYPGATLLGINRMLSNKEYRKQVVANIKDPIVRSFWIDEFAKYTERFAAEATPAIQNKIGQFISNNLIRNIIGQPTSTLDIRRAMDEGKIILVDISRGRIGEDASRLLGALIVNKIQLAAMSRVDMPEKERKDFYLYVDEFQHFATESFTNILSEARKYHLNLIMAHQYIKQMEEHVMDAVFGNVGTIVSFRVGAEDAEFLEKWFSPDFMAHDIVNLGKYTTYMKLMIDGISSKGFSANSLPPFPKPGLSYSTEMIQSSREKYSIKKELVEKNITEWSGTNTDEGQADQGPPPRPRRDFDQPRQRFDDRPRQDRPNYNNQRSSPPRRDDREERPRYDNRPPQQLQQRPNPAPDQRPIRPADRPQPQLRPASNPGQGAKPVSLGDAFKTGAVNFKGKKLDDKPKQQSPRAEVNTDELRKLLQESLAKAGKKEE